MSLRFLFPTIRHPLTAHHLFCTTLFSGNLLCAAHAYRVKVTPTFLRAEYLYKLFIILCPFSLTYSCIHSFISERVCACTALAVDTVSSFSPSRAPLTVPRHCHRHQAGFVSRTLLLLARKRLQAGFVDFLPHFRNQLFLHGALVPFSGGQYQKPRSWYQLCWAGRRKYMHA